MPLTGDGYFAGEYPGGTTTVEGAPVSAAVLVYQRDSGQLIAQTESSQSGEWIVTGVDLSKAHDIVGRKEGFNDVIVSGVMPTSMIDITYSGAVVENETFTGAEGYIEVVGGIPPYAASVVDPLPAGIFPVVNGRQLIIDGTTTDDDVFNSTVRITSSNGVEKIIPLQLVVGFKAPANFEAETLEDAGAFSVLLTWEVTNTTQEVLVFRSATPFDLESMPAPIATLTGDAVSYTDDDVIEDDEFYYMVASVCESFTLYSDEVREVVGTGDPHWDNVVSLLHFDGDLVDEANLNRAWGGAYVASPNPGIGGSSALDKSARISVPDSANNLPTPWVFYDGECTLEFFLQRDSAADNGNVISLWSSNIRFKCEIISSNLVFTAFIGGVISMTFGLPFIDSSFEHIAIVRGGDGIFSAFRRGVKLSQTYGPYSGYVHAGTGGSVTAGGVTFDELRITKGVARYTANFTPPTEPFPNF